MIFEVIQKLEYVNFKEEINLNLDKYIQKKKEKIDEIGLKNNSEIQEYLIDINKDELEKIINDIKEENMKEFILHLITEIQDEKDINLFSNCILMKKLSQENIDDYYKIDFLSIIELLDLYIERIINTIIPPELKYICKIVYMIIEQKFPKSKKYEIYSFIGKNIINKLLIDLFRSPLDIYLNEFLLSKITKENLNFIIKILNKLISLKLYYNKENEFRYTNFNMYFIKKMPMIFKFYENITKIELPKVIELYLNNKLNDNYQYNYFDKKDKEIMIHKSLIFTIEDIICLIKNIKTYKNILFHKSDDKKIEDNTENKIFEIFNQLNTENNLKLLSNLNIINNSTNNQNYILMQELIINPKYNLDIQDKKEYFYINELPFNENNFEKNIIIKTKNYISYILYYSPKLTEFNFSENNNIISIFSDLKNYLKYPEKNIYFQYYINSLIDCIKKLEQKYIGNNFELLINELIKEINESIELLDFQMMTDYLGKIKNCEKKIELNENIIKILRDLEVNKKVENIIYEKNANKFKYELKANENGKVICYNIEQFINNYYMMERSNIYIKKYLDFIFDILENDEKIDKNNDELDIIKEKIFDYIFIKLYDKLYPQEPTKIDIQILMNCEKLSWVEPRHFIKCGSDIDFNIFMNDIQFYFDQLENERNPKKKFKNIIDIFEIISKIIIFIGLDNNESDEENYLGILKYIIINIKPKRLNSILEYVQSFSYEINQDNMNKLKLLMKTSNILNHIKYSDLIEISEEEYKLNCEQVLNRTDI